MGSILACGDTNAAVDNLLEGLVNKGLRVVRLGQPAKVCCVLLGPQRCKNFLLPDPDVGAGTAADPDVVEHNACSD